MMVIIRMSEIKVAKKTFQRNPRVRDRLKDTDWDVWRNGENHLRELKDKLQIKRNR